MESQNQESHCPFNGSPRSGELPRSEAIIKEENVLELKKKNTSSNNYIHQALGRSIEGSSKLWRLSDRYHQYQTEKPTRGLDCQLICLQIMLNYGKYL